MGWLATSSDSRPPTDTLPAGERIDEVDNLRRSAPSSWPVAAHVYNPSTLQPMSEGMLLKVAAFSYCMNEADRMRVARRGSFTTQAVWWRGGAIQWRMAHAADARGLTVGGRRWVIFHRYWHRGAEAPPEAQRPPPCRTKASHAPTCPLTCRSVGAMYIAELNATNTTAVALRHRRAACVEKNWIPWTPDGRTLLLTQQLEPHVVLRCNQLSGRCLRTISLLNRCPAQLAWGCAARHGGCQPGSTTPRGGTPLVEVRPGLLVGVAHMWHPIRSVQTAFSVRRRYMHAFYAVRPWPPYCVTNVSRWFRFADEFGDERDFIQMALGAALLPATDELLVTYGVADCVPMRLRLPVRRVLTLLQGTHDEATTVGDNVHEEVARFSKWASRGQEPPAASCLRSQPRHHRTWQNGRR